MSNMKTKPQVVPQEVPFLGYIFKSDGNVYRNNGKMIKPLKDAAGILYVTLTVNGKKKRYNLAKTMYGLFNNEFIKRSFIIVFKDNDKTNCCPSNLQKMPLRDYYRLIDKKTARQKMMSDQMVNEIKEKYNRGHHFVNQFDKDNDGYSIRDLAREYHCSINTIQRILNDKY